MVVGLWVRIFDFWGSLVVYCMVVGSNLCLFGGSTVLQCMVLGSNL
jgi:hypothetical protein